MSVRRLVCKAALPILIGIAVLTGVSFPSDGGHADVTTTARAAIADDLHWG